MEKFGETGGGKFSKKNTVEAYNACLLYKLNRIPGIKILQNKILSIYLIPEIFELSYV